MFGFGFWVGVKIFFGFGFRFWIGYKNFWVLGLGLGFGYKIFLVFGLGLGIIPNPIPKPKTQFFLGTNVWKE
jgi:hypothetical protein